MLFAGLVLETSGLVRVVGERVGLDGGFSALFF